MCAAIQLLPGLPGAILIFIDFRESPLHQIGVGIGIACADSSVQRQSAKLVAPKVTSDGRSKIRDLIL